MISDILSRRGSHSSSNWESGTFNHYSSSRRTKGNPQQVRTDQKEIKTAVDFVLSFCIRKKFGRALNVFNEWAKCPSEIGLLECNVVRIPRRFFFRSDENSIEKIADHIFMSLSA